MKKIIVMFLYLIIAINSWSQTILPIEKIIGKLHISIDPRIELLNAIQVTSNYKYIDRNSPYGKEISEYFKPYSSNSAVLMTDDLEIKNKFMLAAPVQLVLSFSSLPELDQQTDYSTYLIKRAGSKETIDNYRTAIKLFAKESNFEQFWKSNHDFYNKILELTFHEMAGVDLIKIIENYFKEEQNSYNIIITTLAYGSYACKIEVSDNKYDIYSCNVTRDYKNGIPYVKREVLFRNATHEFCHSFVNYLTDKYSQRVTQSELLYQPIKSAMNLQSCGSWKECVNEHIVRALNIRIHQLNWEPSLWQRMLEEEKANQFVYIEPILNKLKEFEILRDKNNITFAEFYPQILDILDSLKTTYQKTISLKGN